MFTAPRDTRYEPKGRVVTRAHQSGAMALNMDTGACFELNATGSEIWRRLLEGCTAAEVAPKLAAAWGIAPEVCERDALALIEQLVQAGLLAPRGKSE